MYHLLMIRGSAQAEKRTFGGGEKQRDAVPGEGRNQAVGNVYQDAGTCLHDKSR
jgi:hypothetical protein